MKQNNANGRNIFLVPNADWNWRIWILKRGFIG